MILGVRCNIGGATGVRFERAIMEVLHLPANQCTRIGVGDDHWQPANVPRLWRRLDAREVVEVARSWRVDFAVGVIPLANDHVGGGAIRTYTENMQSDSSCVRNIAQVVEPRPRHVVLFVRRRRGKIAVLQCQYQWIKCRPGGLLQRCQVTQGVGEPE